MMPILKKLGNKILRASGKKAVDVSDLVLGPDWSPWLRDGIVTKHRPPFLSDPAYCAAVEHLVRNQAYNADVQCFESYPVYRMYIVWQLARLAARIPGDFVEFGTYRGGHAYIILAATEGLAPDKPMYLYDTFTGTPAESLTESERALRLAGRWGDTSLDSARKVLQPFAPRTHLRIGVIPESLSQPGPERIGLMHVDLNVARPTVDALKWAYPSWSPGGLCILDDYLWEDKELRPSLDEFFGSRGLQIVSLPTGQAFVFNLPSGA